VAKKIIVCLDGTGNEIKGDAVTNVFKIAQLADLRDPARQVLYYGPGVGTLPAPGAWTRSAKWVSKVIGGQALGHGMREDIGDAYRYLMNTWEPGDTVYVFGFSRGAYTARALCGMLYRVGLMRPGSDNLIPYAVRVYARRPGKDSDLSGDEGWQLMDTFSEGLSQRITGDRRSFPIKFLGLFDTVKGTGIVGRDLRWPYTNQLPNVEQVVHAVSIDEWRVPFRESLVPPPNPEKTVPKVSEAWFAGIHSDVGGGFVNNPELGNISMRWILDAAITAGLEVRAQRYMNRYTLTDGDASHPLNTNGSAWRLTGRTQRTIPPGAKVHASVRTRMAGPANYHPKLPDNVVWENEDWTGPPAL
jgi:uncharacterized protein (DUF2235 family)